MRRNYRLTLHYVKWFFIWALIYSFLLWILGVGAHTLSLKYSFLNNKILYAILLGLGISLLSKVISCAIHKKTLYFNSSFFYWWLIFSLLLLLLDFLLELIFPLLSLKFVSTNIFVILLKGALLSISISFLRRANFGSGHRIYIPEWIWWVLGICLVIFLIQFHVPYGEPQLLSDYNLYCNDGKLFIKDDMFGLGKWTTEMEAGFTCMDYKSSRCRYVCDDGKPACQCETALVHYLFTRKGEWIFGGW